MSSAPHHTLIVFTRLPVPGKTKTRLIPHLGREGAAALQRRMSQHTIGRAWAWTLTDNSLKFRVAWEGGTLREMRDWMGPLDFIPQGTGDLGQRMAGCFRDEFALGACGVLLAGTDCPRLNETILTQARQALKKSAVVLGPAEDGGYYLIGLSRPLPRLFENMPWSTGQVLEETIRRAREENVEPFLLLGLPDVDLPPDLPDADAALEAGRSVSVIVPALNEAENLARLLPLLRAGNPLEILVADGGSTDPSAGVAARNGVRFLTVPRSRARQMNAAAREARGDHLLFLHADTDPPDHYCGIIAAELAGAGVAAGAFRFALREPLRCRALIEKAVALRCALWSLPYGDQGLFLRRSLFQAVGGFPDQPILEDLELVTSLRRMGRIAITPECAPTSARRWREGGAGTTFWHHQRILLGHSLGVPAQRLATWRRSRHGS